MTHAQTARLSTCLDESMDLAKAWPLPGAPVLRDALLKAYADPARGYHDTRHLAEVLARLDELAGGGERFAAVPVRLAAWFHDAVYDGLPGAEERSARWAEDALPGAGFTPEQVSVVARLVRMTERHRPEPDDPDGCALSDADLAILAAPAERYAEYVSDVRREYASLPDEEFRRGRAAVLRDLAGKTRLFATAYARAHWEDAARTNLARELAELG